METHKFEEIARSKFEEREIQPSARAWDKLDAMLEEASPSKKNRGVNWFAIAAVFIGFIVIGSVVFNETEFLSSSDLVNEDPLNEVFKDEKKLYNTKNTQQKELLENQSQKDAVATSSINEEKYSTEQKVEKPSKSSSMQTKNERLGSVILVKKNVNRSKGEGQNVKYSKVTTTTTTTITNSNDTWVEKEIDNDLNKQFINPNSSDQLIQNTQKGESFATTDIDLLLKNAQEKIAKQGKSVKEKVDAMALLGDVELEMVQTLREKVFYALGEGLDYVKNSIVDRGN
ncbi:hypothetical protein [Patiriisocius sp. Uisw_017]|uniref:hypothetical protein n=1 Tax=Patiriisocius sp. Uisw_017 TaxID=3230968 RepID=UPI0039E89CB9